jgi:pimeloyl-ACP methyl ester carboxylesterase
LQIAIRHHELVRKMVLAAVSYNSAGQHPGLLANVENLTPEGMVGTPFYEEYARLAPRPEDWPKLVARIKQLDREVQDWPAEAIRSIQAPALIIIGDSDLICPEHAVEMFRLFGGGVAGDIAPMPKSRLAILPGTSHITLVHRAQWLVSMITEFLDN